MFRHPILLALPALLMLTQASRAEDYEIKLDRPDKAGDKYHLVTTLDKKGTQTVSMGGMVIQSKKQNAKATLTGNVEIQKVDKKGGVLKQQIEIISFTDDTGAALLKKGDIVIAETIESKAAFRLSNGGDLNDKVKAILRDLVKTRQADVPSIDDSFGSSKRRKIGESWSVKPEGLAKTMKVDAKTVSGKMKLVKTTTFDGEKCVQVTANVKIGDFPGAAQLKKSGFVVKTLKFNVQLTGVLPIDITKPVPTRSVRMTMNSELTGPNGVALSMSLNFFIERTRTPIK